MNKTLFSLVYDSFLSKITDDMYLELTELDTYQMLEQLLLSAIKKFEYTRVNLNDYELVGIIDQVFYNGAESNYQDTVAIVYEGGYFNNHLSHQEINILAVYMIVEWLSQQLASVENTRMKYSGSDFKFTSQANHMQKLLQMKKDYEREGFHLQRLYKRRFADKKGIKRSSLFLLRGAKAGYGLASDRTGSPTTIINNYYDYDDDDFDEDYYYIYDGGDSYIEW